MADQPRHFSAVYRDLRAIDPADKQRYIRIYEEKEGLIGRLDPLEYFELTVLYVDALFATGAHREHLLMVDLVLFTSIDQNIQFLEGEDIYERMLFRKAASAFRVMDYPLSEHVCKELIKLYPTEPLYERLLRTTRFRQQKKLLQFGRATAIFCFLLTALVIVLDLLIVKYFYPAEHSAMIWLRNDVFLLGIFTLLACYSWAFYQSWRLANQFRNQALISKQKKIKHHDQT